MRRVMQDLKVVVMLWDGVRYDALDKVGGWVGLPNIHRLIRGGTLFTNTFTQTPVLTPTAVGRITKNKQGKWITQSLFEKTNNKIKSCFVGYPEEGYRRIPEWIPHCKFLGEVTYDRDEEFRRLYGTPAERASMHMHRVQYPDKFRVDIACKMIPKYNFTFIYCVEPDTNAHYCRDHKRHVYHYGSPYIKAIKNCDNMLYHVKRTLDGCAKGKYILIVVADHGMTDGGRHSIATWRDEEVMRVPLVLYGRGIRRGWLERTRYYTHDITSGIVGLFTDTVRGTMFQWAMANYADGNLNKSAFAY